MNLKEAALSRDYKTRCRAMGQLSDQVRARGGTYKDAVALVQRIYADAGRPLLSPEDFEDAMQECEEQEARGE